MIYGFAQDVNRKNALGSEDNINVVNELKVPTPTLEQQAWKMFE
jgi:hypothetical protein